MFSAVRPSDEDIERFLSESRHLSLSYQPVGIATAGALSFDVDEETTHLGTGEPVFARARAALTGWSHFRLGWVDIFPRNAAIAPGTDVAVLIRHLGFWSLNGCRVVYSIGGMNGMEFGFAYGTLGNHAETGEELFKVVFDETSGDVTYVIRAVSKPRSPLARLGYPVVRSLQARFRRDSARMMRGAVSAPVPGPR